MPIGRGVEEGVEHSGQADRLIDCELAGVLGSSISEIPPAAVTGCGDGIPRFHVIEVSFAATDPINGNARCGFAGFFGARVKKRVELRKMGRSGAHPGNEGLGERVGSQLKVGIQTHGIQVGGIFGQKIGQHGSERMVTTSIAISPTGSFAVPAVAIRIFQGALTNKYGIFDERLREFLVESLVFERAAGGDIRPARKPCDIAE